MPRRIIQDLIKNQSVHSLRAGDTAHMAAMKMTEHDVAAIVVLDDNEALVGIATERDITRKIVARDLDAKTVSLGDIMTSNPTTVSPEDSVQIALDLMRIGKFRHLPVIDGDRVAGVVSMRGLRTTIAQHSLRRKAKMLLRGQLPRG